MNNKLKRKFISGLMLTVFTLSNTGMASFAANDFLDYEYREDLNTRTQAPIIRGAEEDSSVKLVGDVTFTNRKVPITLSLRESSVEQVLRMFADKAGYNIVFYDTPDNKITMDLVDVPLNDAFEMVMDVSKLTFVIKDKTLVVAKADNKDFTMSREEINLIPVKYVDASTIAKFLNANVYSMKRPGSSGENIAVTNPATNEIMIFGSKQDVQLARRIVEKFDKKPTTTTFKVNHTTPAEMADMICNMLKPALDGSGATGGAAGIATGFASASSTSSASSIQIGGGAIACTFGDSAGASGDLSSMGLQNLSVSYFSQLGTISILGGSESQIETIKEFVAQMDKKQPQAYLEVSIIELSEAGSKTLDNAWNFRSNFISMSFSDGTTQTDRIYPIFLKGNNLPIYDSESFQDPDYSKVGQFAKWSGSPTLTWAIQYVLSSKKGRTVANPRILITNGQESVIDLTSDYVESVDSEMTASGTGNYATKTYNIASDNGIKVSITPFISPDGYVTLNIKPEYSTIKDQEYANDAGGRYLAATLLQRRNLDLKNVRIKDGETLVIGGMIREVETKTVKKIPGLGDLPVIGAAFRSSGAEKEKEEMIIMITPRIITDTEDASSAKNNSL
ncbi:type II secretion system protein GspD [bacterium]|nr:type II secretion system protein GspD [bacterium]